MSVGILGFKPKDFHDLKRGLSKAHVLWGFLQYGA
jgi:hypothetical protein